jgi:hypothetical protein
MTIRNDRDPRSTLSEVAGYTVDLRYDPGTAASRIAGWRYAPVCERREQNRCHHCDERYSRGLEPQTNDRLRQCCRALVLRLEPVLMSFEKPPQKTMTKVARLLCLLLTLAFVPVASGSSSSAPPTWPPMKPPDVRKRSSSCAAPWPQPSEARQRGELNGAVAPLRRGLSLGPNDRHRHR